MKRQFSRVAVAGLAGVVLTAFSPSAFASLTEVIANRFGQPDPREIIGHVYSDPVTANGDNFAGSTITATRMPDDTSSEALTGQKFVANAVARFSDNTESYGVISGGTFTPVFTVTGKNYDVSGSGTIKVDAGQSFGRSGNSGTQSSTPSENADGRDHVVTYTINGSHPDPQYLQFWEDLNKTASLTKGRTTSDYNDLVVKLAPASASGGGSVGGGGDHVIPLPPAVWSAALMAVLMALPKRRSYSGPRPRPFRQ
jgi:hypothetical protein